MWQLEVSESEPYSDAAGPCSGMSDSGCSGMSAGPGLPPGLPGCAARGAGGGFPALTAHVPPRGHGARARDSDGSCLRFKLRLPGRAGDFAPNGQCACVLRGSGQGEGYTRSKSRPDPSHDARSESQCQIRVTMPDLSLNARSESWCQIRVTMPDQSQKPEPILSKTSPNTSTVGCFESHSRLATSLRRGISVAVVSSYGEKLAVWDSRPSEGPADLGYDSDGTAGLPSATVGPGRASEQPVH